MRIVSKIRLTALAAGLCMVAPLAAHATDFTFTGSGLSGTDPLGSGWTAGPNEFGFSTFVEPLTDNGFPTFKGGDGLADATSLTFTYTGTVPNGFNMELGSGLTHIASPQGTQWITTFLSPTTVEFTAPKGDELKPGDTFDVQVAFDKKITANNFSFTATWAGVAAVPEPSSWALMIMGAGAVGSVMRRKRAGLATA